MPWFVTGWEAAFGRAWSDFDDLWLYECLLIALATVVCVSCRECVDDGIAVLVNVDLLVRVLEQKLSCSLAAGCSCVHYRS